MVLVYIAFGNEREVTSQNPATDTNPFRYCGEYYDLETDSYYLRARYYNPVTSRMLSEDPIRDGLNWYIYAGNNPLFYVDPFGLAMVALRAWFDSQLSYVSNSYNGTGSLDWVAATRTAHVSMQANGYGGYVLFTDGVGKTYIGKDGLMYVDDTLLWAAFGYVIDPPLSNKGDPAFDFVIDVAAGGIAGAGRSVVKSVAKGIGRTAATSAGEAAASTATRVAGQAICFVGGTLVYAENGFITIENISTGDFVYSEDVYTGEKGLKKVVQTFENQTYNLVRILTNTQEVYTTDEHPFYVPSKGWVGASNLQIGDILLLESGENSIVEEVLQDYFDISVTVYNFEVEDWHTYYVTDSKILVHNACGAGGFVAKSAAELERLVSGKFHGGIKNQILKDVAKELDKKILNQLGTNPDIAINSEGIIQLVSRSNPGYSIITNLNIFWY